MTVEVIDIEAKQAEARARLEEAQKLAQAEIVKRMPMAVKHARESVVNASQPFYQNPSRETAIQFADACRKAAKKIRVVQAPADAERQALSTVMEDMSVVLGDIARELKHVNLQNVPSDVQARMVSHSQRLAKNEAQCNALFVQTSQALVVAITKQLIAEGILPAPESETSQP